MFTGHGYDEKFTHHMSQLIDNMSADTECAISEGCDEICQKCPNRNKEICWENDKVYKMDAKVISVCGIDYGDMVRLGNIAEDIRKRVFDTKLFEEICSECEWHELCRKTKERIWKSKE